MGKIGKHDDSPVNPSSFPWLFFPSPGCDPHPHGLHPQEVRPPRASSVSAEHLGKRIGAVAVLLPKKGAGNAGLLGVVIWDFTMGVVNL